jgi:hypothetical protein
VFPRPIGFRHVGIFRFFSNVKFNTILTFLPNGSVDVLEVFEFEAVVSQV